VSDERAFIEKICTHPDDDTARLVYADWLEEHDRQQQAEFIRISIQIAILKKEPGWLPTEEELARWTIEETRMLFRLNNYDREKKIEELRERLKAIEPIALDPIVSHFTKPKWKLSWERGFVEAITCTAEDFLAVADQFV
jgi:uncharacterized protein (TIGR02996 family)